MNNPTQYFARAQIYLEKSKKKLRELGAFAVLDNHNNYLLNYWILVTYKVNGNDLRRLEATVVHFDQVTVITYGTSWP